MRIQKVVQRNRPTPNTCEDDGKEEFVVHGTGFKMLRYSA